MSNISAVAEKRVPLAIGYGALGTIIGASNLLIGLSIARQSALRQLNQYVLLMALAFADAGNMFAFASAGFHRLWTIYSGKFETPVTPLSCLTKPHVLLWMVFYVYAALMLIVISADRLFLVSFPSTYLLSLPSPQYAKRIVGITLAFTVFMAGIGVAAIYRMAPAQHSHSFCFVPVGSSNPSMLNRLFVTYFRNTSYFALSSVIIFIAVPIVHKLKSHHNVGAELHQNENEQSQRRMTKTMAVSCMCTLCLYCIPDQLAYFVALNYGGDFGNWMSRVLWLLSMTNSLANLFIYQLRHDEMRVALKSLFTCTTLPFNLALWPKAATQHLLFEQPHRSHGDLAVEMREVKCGQSENLQVQNIEED